MKKPITLGTVICLLTLFLTLAFKPADNEKKDYVTIHYDGVKGEASLSYSNGTYKNIDYIKAENRSDQTQVLKLIGEQEGMGYKLVTYQCEAWPGNSSMYIATVLLSK